LVVHRTETRPKVIDSKTGLCALIGLDKQTITFKAKQFAAWLSIDLTFSFNFWSFADNHFPSMDKYSRHHHILVDQFHHILIFSKQDK
jgi:hypothetical protein